MARTLVHDTMRAYRRCSCCTNLKNRENYNVLKRAGRRVEERNWRSDWEV